MKAEPAMGTAAQNFPAGKPGGHGLDAVPPFLTLFCRRSLYRLRL